MNRADENKLSLQVLGAPDLDRLRQASLQEVLDAARDEGRRRRRIRSAGLASAPVLLALGLVLSLPRHPQALEQGGLGQAEVPEVPTGGTAVESIDDQQLLALLPGRTVALIGPPGHERLLVFDAGVPRR